MLDTLAATGLHAEVMRERPAFDGWVEAVRRGFLDPEPTAAEVDGAYANTGYRRRLGVTDPTGVQPAVPVGTFATWASRVAVPGGRDIEALAISGVTVAPTHRRRGIARAMMEGELTIAKNLGVPVAMLTASEASIYQRYGFAPAAQAATWTIKTRQAGWRGPTVSGRFDFVTREHARTLLPALHERVWRTEPGEAVMPEPHWDNHTGTRADADKPGEVRAVTFTGAGGTVDGIVVYRLSKDGPEFSDARLTVQTMITATDEAYAAIWGYVIQHDLVATVVVSQRAVDEPVWWMIADQRAAHVEVRDHQYLRLLDVPAALAARTYAAAGQVALHISDPLGFDGGDVLLEVDANGVPNVTRATSADAVHVTLGITELAALYLGGHSARALRTAGRLQTDDADAVDDVFRSRVTPRLSYWY